MIDSSDDAIQLELIPNNFMRDRCNTCGDVGVWVCVCRDKPYLFFFDLLDCAQTGPAVAFLGCPTPQVTTSAHGLNLADTFGFLDHP